MLACTLGRNVILVELEGKFCKMMRDNWEQVKMRPQLGSTMGRCEIIQGDARQLEGLVDKIVTSPPYAETGVGDWQTGRAEFQAWVLNELATKGYIEWQGKRYTESEWRAMNHGRIDGRTTKGVHKHPTEGYGATDGQIGNLPYGEIDKCIFSPPYAENPGTPSLGSVNKDDWGNEGKDIVARRGLERGYSKDTENQIANLPYGQIDKIVTSPPYEGIEIISGNQAPRKVRKQTLSKIDDHYDSASEQNIGNLKSQSYLEAMLQVYQQCYKVLRDKGLMILVTKNFIRNKQIIRLDEDTIKLCEQAEFSFVERHYRELPSQSFWRVIYHQKFPDVEQIKNEDVLVFTKTVCPGSLGK